MPAINKRTCFIITPVGNEKEPIRRHMDGIINTVLIPVLSDEFDVSVAYRITSTQGISQQIIQSIYASDLVIANLSEANPAVMYELAFRHSIGTPVIMIAEEGTNLPFASYAEDTIFYINDALGVLELIEKITLQLETIDYEKRKQGPIYASLGSLLQDDRIVDTRRENTAQAAEPKTEKMATLNEAENAYFKELFFRDEKNVEDGSSVTGSIIEEEEASEAEIEYNMLAESTDMKEEFDSLKADDSPDGPTEETFIETDQGLDDLIEQDIPESVDMNDFLREFFGDENTEADVESEIITLKNMLYQNDAGYNMVRSWDKKESIIERLDNIEERLNSVFISEDHYDNYLIDHNKYFRALNNFNLLYEEINKAKKEKKNLG